MKANTSPSPKGKSPSQQRDTIIVGPGDGRGRKVSTLRTLIMKADPYGEIPGGTVLFADTLCASKVHLMRRVAALKHTRPESGNFSNPIINNSQHPGRRIKCHPAVLLATFVLAACSTAPVTRIESHPASATQVPAPERHITSMDSVVQFLLTAAATDFHAHRPPDPVRFRDVRIGHVMTISGKEQYMLCGQFLPAQQGGNAEWMPFTTIKTSGYEQWIGAQAAAFCQGPSVIWDKVDDVSSLLWSKLDSLR